MDNGISYPFTRGDKGYFKESTGIDLIDGNILQILGTIPGERVMLPDFGSKVRTLLFEHINDGLIALARTYIVDAIKKWEKRVIILDVNITGYEDESYIIVHLRYRYKETGQEKTSTIMVTSNEGVRLVDSTNAT